MSKYIPAGLIFSALFALPAQAQFVTPASYTATAGEGIAQGGSFNYFDDMGTQLTDNVTGVNNWMANLGNGEAFEWVGWKVAEPSLSFNFASLVNISQVQIGFNRSDDGSGIFLPSTVNIGSNNFSLNNTEINNRERGFLTFEVSFSGTNGSVNRFVSGIKLEGKSSFKFNGKAV
jgi:hypothetical protein